MRSQWLIHGVLATWTAIMIVVGSSLMVSHWIPLPRPAVLSPQISFANWHEEASGGWRAYHFLYMECPCSQRVLKHVTERAPHPGINEKLVLIGHAAQLADAACRLGYEVDCVSPTELKVRYGVETAPLLVVIDPEGKTRYSGGYTSRKQVLDIQDGDIIGRVLAGEDVEPLPLFGCAVSRKLQSMVDPLGFKYRGR
jgi:hypothetical protein